MEELQLTPKSKHSAVVAGIFSFVIGAVIVGAGVYFWQDRTISDLHRELGGIQSEVSVLVENLKVKELEVALLEENFNEKEGKVAVLEGDSKAKEIEIAKLECSGVGAWKEGVGCVKSALTLITPNGGETFCVGQTFPISWEGPLDMETMNVGLKVQSGVRNMGDYPATDTIFDDVAKGSIQWPTEKWGFEISPGDTYKIQIFYRDKNNEIVKDESDTIFSVKACS